MSPWVSPKCPHCGYPNTFNLEELRQAGATVFRAVLQEEEFRVVCAGCGRPFVFKVREDADERARDR